MKGLLFLILFLPKLLFSQVLEGYKKDSVLVKKILKTSNTSNPKEQFRTFVRLQNKTRFFKWDQWIDYVLKEIAKEKDSEKLFHLNAWLSRLYIKNGEYENSIKIAYQTYHSNKDIIDDRYVLCGLLADLENSFIYLNNTIRLAILVKEKIKTCSSMGDLYNIYSKLGFNADAVKSYRKTYFYNKTPKNKFIEAKHLSNLGVFFERDLQIDSSLYFYKKAYKNIKQYKPKNRDEDKYYDFWVGLIQGNIGSCYVYQKKYKEALRLIELEHHTYLRYEKENGDSYDKRKYWFQKGNCAIPLRNFIEAKKCIDSLSSKKEWLKVYKLKAAYYKETGQQKLLSFALDKIIKIKDSTENASKIKLLKTVEEIKNIDDAIHLQKEQIIKSQESSENRLTVIIITGIFTLVLGILTIYLVLANYKRRRQQKLIIEQKDVIQNNLEDKKLLLTELHHRVKNNMQMISSMFRLQASKIKSKEVKANLKQVINRVKILSHIHSNLYVNTELNQTSLQHYLKEISLFSSDIQENNDIEIKYNIQENVRVHIDQMITLGLIVNELITNSIKYAFTSKKGKISISLIKENNKIYFDYFDNGIGFSSKKIKRPKNNTSSGLGLGLLSRLVNQLGADPQFYTTKGFSLKFNFIDKQDYNK